MNDADCVLIVNAGSSSIKFAVFTKQLERPLRGQLTGIGTHPHLHASDAHGDILVDKALVIDDADNVHELIQQLVAWLEAHLGPSRLAGIGHRVGIGGLEHSGPVVISTPVLESLRSLIPLAPLHQPRNLELIESLAGSHPGLPQVACFDTAFHRTMPPVAQRYGLPRELSGAGAQRYGFHGLSYEYIASRLPALDRRAANGRTVVAHLGSGASMCALQGGHSVATTMGFSPLSGLVMGTRSGDLDPGLMIWLLRDRGMSIAAVEQMLYRDSGLRGVSGVSSDMRELLGSDVASSREAIELFVYKISTTLGSLAAALGGLDSLVFTAGIGEHSPEIRKAVSESACWLGVKISDEANQRADLMISAPDSAVSVWVIPTDEELMVARHTPAELQASSTQFQGE